MGFWSGLEEKVEEIGEYEILLTHPNKPIYTAQNKNREFVLKTINQTQSKDYNDTGTIDTQTLSELLRYEYKIQSRLKHPNICPAIELIEKNKQPYIVLPQIYGSTLEYVVVQIRQTRKEKFLILEQIAGAVAHCHENGIIHLDIKEENIMIDNDGNAILIDFGSAREKDVKKVPKPARAILSFTRQTASPECINYTFTTRSDTFSFAIVAYRLLTRSNAYEEEENGKLKYDRPIFNRGEMIRQGEVGKLIIQGLEINEEERPEMKEIAQAFKEHNSRLYLQREEPQTPCLTLLTVPKMKTTRVLQKCQ